MSRRCIPYCEALGKRTSKGGYFKRAIRFGTRYAPALGGLLGSFYADPGLGARLGKLAGYGLSALGKVTGLGRYRYRGTRIGAGNQVPSFGNLKPSTEGGVVICHREYIKDIKSPGSGGTPTAFHNETFPINPGFGGTFPWLSGIASKFEQYKIRGMLFHYRTMSGNSVASTNTSLGSVVMATEYNAGGSTFLTKSQMENYAHGQSGVPSEDIVHQIECQKSQSTVSQPYIRGWSIPTGQDPRLYDFGVFQIATASIPAYDVVLGELWVTYCIELIKPRLPDPAVAPFDPSDLPMDHYQLNTSTITASNASYFGAPNVLTDPEYKGLGSQIWHDTGNARDQLQLPGYGRDPEQQPPVGTVYRIDYYVVGNTTTLTVALYPVGGTNMTLSPTVLSGSNASVGQAASASNGLQFCSLFLTKVSNASNYGDYFCFTAGTLPASINRADMWVSVIPTDVT